MEITAKTSGTFNSVSEDGRVQEVDARREANRGCCRRGTGRDPPLFGSPAVVCNGGHHRRKRACVKGRGVKPGSSEDPRSVAPRALKKG